MQLIILLIYTPLVYTELHTFITTYTGVTGIEGIPEFWAVSTLDRQQLDYYDSINQTLTPRQKWLEDFSSTYKWKSNTENRKKEQDNLRNRIDKLINHNGTGIHTYQRMYGCSWDNETKKSEGFDMYSYDGETLFTLDINKRSYNTTMQQPFSAQWNKSVQFDFIIFLRHECLYWLKRFLSLATLNRRAVPKISLLQKDPVSHVVCHVTGFYPNGTTITWRKNGQPINHFLVEMGICLPNEDGTFQMRVGLHVIPAEWKKEQYVCVAEHKSWTEKIQTILTEDEVKSNYKKKSEAVFFMVPVVVVVVVVVAVAVVVCLKCLYRRLNSCKFFYNKCPTETQV
ncbi:major histocompatibility complex class I-related gene protein-like isoform X1 [Triplophysa rosa]|uniref:major histocompatibility complex class I-related gene protein-like isoform X1 n=1 Tax=Triplophysa rosa TaxID=992332 RepID=UPI00254630FB|nr:major histocompatibility complex class I-related gene protein-like isoform X1 [Triplophysa rosa]